MPVLNDADALRVGASEVDKVYMGATEVWSGSFDPTTIAGLVGWWDASQITGKSDGNTITQWDDLSGNARHATEATNPPTYKTGIVNSLPVVRFDGINDVLIYAPGSIFISTTTLTAFVVAVRRNSVEQSCLLSVHSTAGSADWNGAPSAIIGHQTGTTQGCYRASGARSYVGSLPAIGSTFTFETIFDATNNTSLRNGVAAAAVASTGSFGISRMYFGRRWEGAGPAIPWQVDFAEVLLFDSAVSSDNRTLIRDYLATKWAVA